MKIKCGNDIVSDERLAELIKKKSFLDKIFHPSEIKNLEVSKLSSVFSLKESVIKALESTTDNWLEIKYKENGKPEIVLSEKIRPKNLLSIDCSVTHENGLTSTVVVLLLQDKD